MSLPNMSGARASQVERRDAAVDALLSALARGKSRARVRVGPGRGGVTASLSEREKVLRVAWLRGQINACHLPDRSVPASGFMNCGELFLPSSVFVNRAATGWRGPNETPFHTVGTPDRTPPVPWRASDERCTQRSDLRPAARRRQRR